MRRVVIGPGVIAELRRVQLGARMRRRVSLRRRLGRLDEPGLDPHENIYFRM